MDGRRQPLFSGGTGNLGAHALMKLYSISPIARQAGGRCGHFGPTAGCTNGKPSI
jgi:hypothetical protein